MKLQITAALTSCIVLSSCIDTSRHGLENIECVLDVSNIFVETQDGKEYLPSWKFDRLESYLEKFNKKHFPVAPATDSRDHNNPIIHFFVLSYDDCDSSAAEIEKYFARKNLTVPDIRISSMDEYKKVFQGKQIFDE